MSLYWYLSQLFSAMRPYLLAVSVQVVQFGVFEQCTVAQRAERHVLRRVVEVAHNQHVVVELEGIAAHEHEKMRALGVT